jgi:hypothetical protein
MPPQEPQYELRDSNGVLQGVVYINANGNLVLHHANSGEEVILKSSGLSIPLADIGKLTSAMDADGNDIRNVGSIATEQIGTGRHYAGAYPGSDPDARLQNALDAAADADTIYLENDSYDSGIDLPSRTLSVTLIGASGQGGTIISNGVTWGLQFGSSILDVDNRGTISLDGASCFVSRIENNGGSIVATADRANISQVTRGSITFNSGTSNCVASGLSLVSTTDNGSGNTFGDSA